jgi:hypothetical protein
MRDLENDEIKAGTLLSGTHKVTRIRETICVVDLRGGSSRCAPHENPKHEVIGTSSTLPLTSA